MSQSSFYGGRPGISFRIVKRFDGIDIPQNPGSIVYKRKEYAIRTITDVKYFIYPFVEKTGSNYQEYDWDICVLDGGSKNVVYSNNTTGTETVEAVPAEGMIQCFSQGGSTTNIVNYGEYVIIDTVKDMADYSNPDNGKLFRRGTNLNYNAETNPYYGGEFIGTLVGSKGDTGAQGPQGIQGIQGIQGEKGDKGNFNFLEIYPTAADIPNNPPEVIGGDPKYEGYSVLVGDVTDPDEFYHLYVYDYLSEYWQDAGLLLSEGNVNNYTVCHTNSDIVAKTVELSGFLLRIGVKVIINFENGNIASNPTLNISSTGAIPLIVDADTGDTTITAGSVYLIVYDGTNYRVVGGAGSGSDGHLILNSNGTLMTQRRKLQFINATVSDDSEHNATIITVPIATNNDLGLIKPDGTSTTIDNNSLKVIGKQNNDYWVDSYVLSRNNWNNKQYSLESVYPSAQYDIVDVLPTTNSTAAQKKAWAKADCGGYNSQNIIIANGDVPSIDIVIGLCIRPKSV